jgi:hypothetical protein
MSASNGPNLPKVPTSGRGPLRVRLAEHPGRDHLDGGWWPQSSDLAVELPDLVSHFPARLGRIVRVLISQPDWSAAPRRIPVAGGYVKVGSLPHDHVHLVHLTNSDRTVLRVLVVPPDFTRGDDALLAAATPGNAHSTADLLDEVNEYPDNQPLDHWADHGEPWWGPHSVAPSFRTGR